MHSLIWTTQSIHCMWGHIYINHTFDLLGGLLDQFYYTLNKSVSVKPLSLICLIYNNIILLLLCAIYFLEIAWMIENFVMITALNIVLTSSFAGKNKIVIHQPRSVHIGNPSVLSTAISLQSQAISRTFRTVFAIMDQPR